MNSVAQKPAVRLGRVALRLAFVLAVVLLGHSTALAQTTTSLTVQFSSSTYSVNENTSTGTAQITVTLSGASTLPVTVKYDMSNGTATDPFDYLKVSGVITFPPSSTSQSQSFFVPIINDTDPELNETVNLTLSGPTVATLGFPSAAVLTILNDDLLAVDIGTPNGRFVGTGKDLTPLQLTATPTPAPATGDVDAYAWSVANGPGRGNFQTAASQNPGFIGAMEGDCTVKVDLQRSTSSGVLKADDQDQVRVIKVDELHEYIPEAPCSVYELTSGSYTVPYSASGGNLLAVLIQPPGMSSSGYVWGTDFSGQVDQLNGNVVISLTQPGPFLVRTIRDGFGAGPISTIFELRFQCYVADMGEKNRAGTVTPIPAPSGDLILVDSTNPDDLLSLMREYFNANNIAFVGIGSVNDAITAINNKAMNNGNVPFSVVIIGHGTIATQVMGSGQQTNAGKYISNNAASAADVTNFTNACKNKKVSLIDMYGCSVSHTDAGKNFIQDIANKAKCPVTANNGNFVAVKIVRRPLFGPNQTFYEFKVSVPNNETRARETKAPAP